jgi:hypothetical protein
MRPISIVTHKLPLGQFFFCLEKNQGWKIEIFEKRFSRTPVLFISSRKEISVQKKISRYQRPFTQNLINKLIKIELLI